MKYLLSLFLVMSVTTISTANAGPGLKIIDFEFVEEKPELEKLTATEIKDLIKDLLYTNFVKQIIASIELQLQGLEIYPGKYNKNWKEELRELAQLKTEKTSVDEIVNYAQKRNQLKKEEQTEAIQKKIRKIESTLDKLMEKQTLDLVQDALKLVFIDDQKSVLSSMLKPKVSQDIKEMRRKIKEEIQKTDTEVAEAEVTSPIKEATVEVTVAEATPPIKEATVEVTVVEATPPIKEATVEVTVEEVKTASKTCKWSFRNFFKGKKKQG